jgi:hypothetical protein
MTITKDDVGKVDAALQPLQEGFVADGGSLAVESDGDTVVVRLVLTDESCGDCIVGPDVLRAIVRGRLADAGIALPVAVVDPRE